MKITCLGAARTVTGSSYLLDMDHEFRFLVDCGMFQGNRQIEQRNWLSKSYKPRELKALFITHAHIDHSGLTPRLVRQGYQGPIYATQATCELLRILWLDSAHIQEMESEWQTRKNKRIGKKGVDPLYETPDAEAAIELLRPLELEKEQELLPGVRVRFVQAGHILGAASLLMTLRDSGGEHRLGFSGDLGRPGQLIIPDPERLPLPDTLFMEATYGTRLHKSRADSQRELMTVIKQAYRQGGNVVIPAFAVERTQELLYTLSAAWRAGDLPADMPVYLDSPLAIAATEIFRAHPEYFDDETKELLANGDTPLDFPNLKFTPSTEESRAINEHRGPAVIIAGNGMGSAGRIKHHLKHNVWRPDSHVVLVGFQAQGTTGRLLVDGATKVKIFREDVAVRATVHTIGGFSAHADRDELLAWLGGLAHPGLRVNVVHTEEATGMAFMEIAAKRFPQVEFYLPRWNEVLGLTSAAPTAAAVPAPAAPSLRSGQVSARLAELARRLERGDLVLGEERLHALEKALRGLEEGAAPSGEA